MKTTIHITLASALLTCLATSCQKEEIFLEKQNPGQITNATFFQSQNDAIYAVNAAYGPLQSGNLYHNQYFNMFDIGIELSPTSNIPASWHISTYTFDATSPPVRDVWTGLYQIVARANFAIQGIDKMTTLTPALKNRLLGEAHFLRGWAYFELAVSWGRVPLFTEFASNAATSNLPRAATELEVYRQAIADFEIAEANLPVSYTGADVGRATKGAAVGYLGKMYLYMASPGVNLAPDGYTRAETYFKRLTGSEFNYGLIDNYLDNFTATNENNRESLFEVQYARLGGTTGAWNAHDFASVAEGTNRARTYGYLNWYNAFMNINYVNRFEATDPRQRYTAYGPPSPAQPRPTTLFNGVVYRRADWSVRKYGLYDVMPANQVDGDSPINFRVMRYADVLLMLAESLVEQGKVAEAIPYVNQVRARVDLPDVTATTQPEARLVVRNERLWELGLEQIRKKDVLRWGKETAEAEFRVSNLSAFRYDVHRYLPIPQQEIDSNLAIDISDQNPGY